MDYNYCQCMCPPVFSLRLNLGVPSFPSHAAVKKYRWICKISLLLRKFLDLTRIRASCRWLFVCSIEVSGFYFRHRTTLKMSHTVSYYSPSSTTRLIWGVLITDNKLDLSHVLSKCISSCKTPESDPCVSWLLFHSYAVTHTHEYT